MTEIVKPDLAGQAARERTRVGARIAIPMDDTVIDVFHTDEEPRPEEPVER